MSFGCGGSDYLVPLAWVQKIADARRTPVQDGNSESSHPEYEDVGIVDLSKHFGSRETGDSGDYMIYLKNGPHSMALAADQVDGVRTVSKEKLIALPEAVKTSANRFLEAVIPFDDGNELHMAYVIEPEMLYSISRM